MNAMVFIIVKLERELEMERERHRQRRLDDLEALKPAPQPKKTDRKKTSSRILNQQACGCSESSN
jgi:hypothetical protein